MKILIILEIIYFLFIVINCCSFRSKKKYFKTGYIVQYMKKRNNFCDKSWYVYDTKSIIHTDKWYVWLEKRYENGCDTDKQTYESFFRDIKKNEKRRIIDACDKVIKEFE